MARVGVYESAMRAAHVSRLALGLLLASACAAPSGPASREIAQPALPSAERASVASAQPVPSSPELAPETPGLYGNVIELPSGSAFVLSASPGEAVRAREPRTGIVGPLAMSEAEVDSESLPREQRLEAQEVDLYEGAEHVCRVRLGRLALAKQAEWEGFDAAMLGVDAPPDGKEPAREVMARAALDYAGDWLVASLPDEPSCARAEWGRLASLPPPVFAVHLAEPDVRTPLARFEATDIWSQHQKSYEEHEQTAMRWGVTPTGGRWADDTSAKLRARAFRFAGQELVLVSIEAGEPCSFQAALSGLFRARPRGLDTVWIQEAADTDGLLVDLDGDGELERVHDLGAASLQGGEWSWTVTRPARFGCSC
jgi:hypothetical protein